MKKLTVILSTLLFVLLMGNQQLSAQSESKETKLDVYYTHTTNRCAGCKAIEKEAIATINESYAGQLKSGEIKLHIVNIDLKENAAFVDQYKVWGSSLFLVKKGDTKPTVDMTKPGFAKARTKPAEFRAELSEQISLLLK
ncbi:MAG: hypothetical protein KG029_13395 [Bacteroidetes bacterium]|nr:hypothetical protein [Bacteroidota bacterium]